MILKIVLLLQTLSQGQIISLEDEIVCMDFDCSNQDLTQIYSYSQSDFGMSKFTLQFFIKLNSNGYSSIANLTYGTNQLSITYSVDQIIQTDINNNQTSAFQFVINNWIAIYITQKNIIYQDYNLQQYQPSNLNIQYGQLTQLKLFNDGNSNYIKGYGCCILIYKGINYLEDIITNSIIEYYDQIIYNQRKPENLININIQEKEQSATTFDYSDYARIVRLGNYFRFNLKDSSDPSDPILVADALNFSKSSYIQIDDVSFGLQFTFEFRLQLSSNQTLQNIVLLEYPLTNKLIQLSGLNLTLQNDPNIQFTLEPSNYYHFCISVVQNLDYTQNVYIINFYQFFDDGRIKNSNLLKTFPNKFYNYGIMRIGSQNNQFPAEQNFLLYHFRLYEGFFLDTTQGIKTNCAVYLNDRCIVCASSFKLSDKHECVSGCSSGLTFSESHNQCIRQCSPQCATCSPSSPSACQSCNQMRTGPPGCSCPNGYFEDYVSPNCIKYLQEQSTQTGIFSVQCFSTGIQIQPVIFNYQYKIAPSVALFLIGFNQQLFGSEVNVFISGITITGFQINVQCSSGGQFYKIQWMSGPNNHLFYQESDGLAILQNLSITASGINQYQQLLLNSPSYVQLLGWKQSTNNNSFSIQITQDNLITNLYSSNQLSFAKYATIQTDFIQKTSQLQQNQILFILDNVPKSIKFAYTLDQIGFSYNYGNFSLMFKNRNQTFLQLQSRYLLQNFKGLLIFAAIQCPPDKVYNFKDEYVKSCNPIYSQCCDEPNYYVNSSHQCDNCDPVCYTCIDFKTKCTQCYVTYYFQVDKCLPCDKACKNCSAGLSTDCYDCYEPKILVISGSLQTCECLPGFYMFENVCFPCLLTCQLCKSIDDCDNCPATRQKINNQCECNLGYYEAQQTECLKCPSICTTCQSENYCTECIDGLLLIEHQCVCVKGQYLQNNNCISCTNPCSTCSSATICTSCFPDKYLNHKTQSCICNDTTYLDWSGICRSKNYSKYIKDCLHPCLNCIISGAICLTCDLNRYLFQQQCLCNPGYFENQDRECQSCSKICSECDNEVTCTKCGINRFEKECICMDGFYEINFECLKCPNMCKNCNNLKQCTSCRDQMVLGDTTCECLKDFYFDGQQCLSCKTQSGLLQPICNIINCGDGIKSINEECDDGNTVKNDGCTDCKIDTGYQCNNLLLQTSYCNKCQGNCKTCSYFESQIICQYCDDGYYLSNNSCLKCNQYCQQCLSLQICTQCSINDTNPNLDGKCPECEEGQQLQDGICQSVCGDGLLGKGEDCDFGQQNGSGGCSLQCTEQKGFNCFQNLCNKIKEQQIDVQYVNSTTKTLFVIDIAEFQPKIFCNNNIQLKIDNFTQDEYIQQFSVVNDKCNLQLEYKKTITEQNLIRVQIPLDDSRILYADVKEVVIVPRKKIYYSEQQVEQSKNIKLAQDQFKILIQFLGPLLALIGGFSCYLTILDILSWVNNLYYINIQFPLNVQLIFQTTLWDDIQLVPSSQLPEFNLPSDPYYRESPPHFMEKGNDPLFINNAFQTFGLWGLYIIGYLLAKVIVSVFRRKQLPRVEILQQVEEEQQQIQQKPPKDKKQSKIILKILKICQPFVDNAFSYFIRLLNLSYLDLLSAIVLHLYCYDIDQTNYQIILINYILVFLSLLFCIYMTYLTWYASTSHIKMLQNRVFMRIYGSIFENININNQEAILYSFINLIRKSLYTIFVVLFYQKPLFQTTFCCLVSFINVAFILFQNPFDSRQNLIQTGVPDLCIFLLMIVFTICALDDYVSVFSDLQRFNIGWIIIGIIMISILVQFYFIFQQIYEDTIIKIKWIKEKLKLK